MSTRCAAPSGRKLYSVTFLRQESVTLPGEGPNRATSWPHLRSPLLALYFFYVHLFNQYVYFFFIFKQKLGNGVLQKMKLKW